MAFDDWAMAGGIHRWHDANLGGRGGGLPSSQQVRCCFQGSLEVLDRAKLERGRGPSRAAPQWSHQRLGALLGSNEGRFVPCSVSQNSPPPLAPHRRAVAAAGFAQSKGAHGRKPEAQVTRSAVALDAGLGRISSASRDADSSSPAGERMRVRENEDEGERRGRRERITDRARTSRRRPARAAPKLAGGRLGYNLVGETGVEDGRGRRGDGKGVT